jgi:alkylation response protein AidB-like acyl-CoA dehydrogenase
MDLNYSPEEEQFRQRVRDFLKANLPPGWGTPGRPRDESVEFLREWQRKLFENGFLGLTWPRKYGGQEASLIKSAIFAEEIARHRAPSPLNALGLTLAGPTILVHGTEEQKDRYVRKILSAEEIWCQGFSEPGSGSDLASLRTRAEIRGDEFVVSGQKIWTSSAQIADRCMLLVRTDPRAPKHRGISYLLLDMHSPGVTVRPLRQIDGRATFNEVFFDEVRIPRENLLGELNHGWYVALTTLMNERVSLGLGRSAVLANTLSDLVALCRRLGVLERPQVRQQLAQFHVDLQGLRYIALRTLSAVAKGGTPGPEGSLAKITYSELSQRMEELAMSVMGPASQVVEDSAWGIDGGYWQADFLRSRSETILGGTSEIQRNIIAERVLALPKVR